MPPCCRQVKIDMRVDLWPARGTCSVSGDREVAVDMLPCCRRGAGVAGAARRDHNGYSDAPGRPVLPDGGTLPRLAHHAEKNSETRSKKSRRSRSSGPLGALLSSPALVPGCEANDCTPSAPSSSCAEREYSPEFRRFSHLFLVLLLLHY